MAAGKAFFLGVLLLAPARNINYISISFSKDGKQLASAGLNYPIKIWDVATGKETRRVAERSDWTSPALFTPDGNLIARDDKNRNAQLFSLTGDGKGQDLGYGGTAVPWEFLSSDGKVLVRPSDKNNIALVDLASRKVLKKLISSEMVWSAAVTPDGKSLVAAIYSRAIGVYDLAEPGRMTVLASPLEQCYSMAISPDGKIVVGGSMSGTIFLWDSAKAHTLIRSMKHPGALTAVAFSPDGSKLASVSFAKSTRIWDVATGKELHSFSGGESSAAFSPDGKILATGGGPEQPFIWLWDVETGKELKKLDAR